MADDKKFMTSHQVANELGVTIPTVLRWVEQGHLSCVRTVGGHRRFRTEDVERFIADREKAAS